MTHGRKFFALGCVAWLGAVACDVSVRSLGDEPLAGTSGSSGKSAGGATQNEPPGEGGAPSANPPTAGQGGGDDGPARISFPPSCEPYEMSISTDCSFEQVCEQLGCGDGISRFGEDGCARYCGSSDDCAPGQRCRYTGLSGVPCASGSELDGCELDASSGVCTCAETSDCGQYNICVIAEKYPPELDCQVDDATCDQLLTLLETISWNPDPARTDEIAEAIDACVATIEPKLLELGCGSGSCVVDQTCFTVTSPQDYDLKIECDSMGSYSVFPCNEVAYARKCTEVVEIEQDGQTYDATYVRYFPAGTNVVCDGTLEDL